MYILYHFMVLSEINWIEHFDAYNKLPKLVYIMKINWNLINLFKAIDFTRKYVYSWYIELEVDVHCMSAIDTNAIWNGTLI